MNALNLTVKQKDFPTEGAIETYSQLDEFLDILQLLIREPSVVDSEDSFFRVLRRELE
ncbi:hypothetical protein [Myxosarcina sp. GI1(2024)]